MSLDNKTCSCGHCSELTLKSNNANKELIKWAKALRKSNINLFTSSLIYSHSYSLRRRNLLQAKKLLRIQEEEGFINDQLEDTENNQEEEEIYPTQVTRVTSQEANQHVQNEITGGDPLSQNLEDEYVNVNMLQDLKSSHELSSDFDWIRHSIYTLLRLYESDKLKKAHRESWYLSHIWQFIDNAFDNIKNIDVLSQECSSVSSSKRKNKDRSIGGVEMRERKKVGYRCDMIFCENRIGHDERIEYGASEAGKLYDGDEGTKRLEEGSKKLPKCLKDMLDHLLLKKDDRSKIQTIGFVHSGLESFFMTADRPVKYATRITKSRRTHISNDISGFGSTILPALYSAWMAKEVVKNVQDVLRLLG
ncbi:hypothetical protein G6F57_013052 [Rhizopus arrhizus]|uniref:PH domain-containing protein n=1 Tax=Rhizopus oryzae TaxID=64495 RepID=A0A9P6WY35_RHIOR|nr:hypothetical protein G6F23_011831 [Rhizopus arrhizus]KAG0754679.1 hypothetical protein G6F24_012327 [Rhizopus arrhizus]KAG0780704.1 hypothetical protein G6F21_012009 [Rhizopus arrhizus]KAG0805142.1 hypothetical protein G6F20_012144 [Rhizopus arrhizus]KAG0820887.1 hypothetical protein G6F19_012222 [Rhizopus arrhizus]